MCNIKQIKETSYKITLDQEEYDYLRLIFNKFYGEPLNWPKEGGIHRMNLWEIFNQFNKLSNNQTTGNENLKDNLVANSPDNDFDLDLRKTND